MIASLLRPIALSKICQVIVSHAGLQVITELNGVLQASAYIGRGLFDEFTFVPDDSHVSSFDDTSDDESDEDVPVAMFDVSLEAWLTSLNIYGTASGFSASTSMSARNEGGFGSRDADVMRRMPFARGRSIVEMIYQGKGFPLKLEIREGKVLTNCELATFETNTVVISEMPYLAERTVAQVIIHSRQLTESLTSIDPSCRRVTFAFRDGLVRPAPTQNGLPRTPTRTSLGGPGGGGATTLAMTSQSSNETEERETLDTHGMMREAPGVEMMRISAVGDIGSTELDFPNRNRVFESFSIQFPSKHTYAFTNIQHCLRAVQSSIKTSIRIDDQGMMSLQCLFPERPLAERELEHANDSSGPERRGFVEVRMLPAVTDEDL